MRSTEKKKFIKKIYMRSVDLIMSKKIYEIN